MFSGRWFGFTGGAVASLVALSLALSCGGGKEVPADRGPRGNDGGGGNVVGDLAITPGSVTITVSPGKKPPAVQFRVTERGKPVDAVYSVDHPEIGTVDADGVLQLSGRVAGVLVVSATVGEHTVTARVTVEVTAVQNGGTEAELAQVAGPGGFQGVGGEGIGPAVTDAQAQVLRGPKTADPELAFLYPYNGTVFPLGFLAPLLMWDAGSAAQIEAIGLKLSATGYSWEGFFARPERLAAGSPYVRHPIPLAVWQAASLSARGGELQVELTVARGGRAYGPIRLDFEIAEDELQGCIYYQSYFTNLARNYTGAMGIPDGRFGGATLGIRPGGFDPVLVAGGDGGVENCRVCHSVAADGSRMVVQHGEAYDVASSYDLQNGYAETSYGANGQHQLAMLGITPDGALGLTNSARLFNQMDADVAALYDLETGQPVTAPGLSEFVTRMGLPAFSHDGQMAAFNFMAGPGTPAIGPGDGRKLVVMDFERGTRTFSNPRLLHEGDERPGWASFYPDGAGVVFQLELTQHDYWFETRSGGRGELWWSHLATGTSARLDRANGRENGQLSIPTGPNGHDNDAELNFEPTVSPVRAGRYAWVVFMSRRRYGNVIETNPWWSDPRDHDLTQSYSPKKLWIAAIDLEAAPGTDPSRPAFYLPAQEIQASNSRGYWTSDPCVYTGQM